MWLWVSWVDSASFLFLSVSVWGNLLLVSAIPLTPLMSCIILWLCGLMLFVK